MTLHLILKILLDLRPSGNFFCGRLEIFFVVAPLKKINPIFRRISFSQELK